MTTLYTAQATATGGRTGSAKSSDGRLDVTLDTVKELGGAGGAGTNPCLLYTSPSPRDRQKSRMPSSA